MIFQDKVKLLGEYMKANVCPILVDFITANDINDAIVINANCEYTDLVGSYDNDKFILPEWFRKIISRDYDSILMIDGIDSISKEEQFKFVELIKYRQVNTNKIPNNTVIIITAKDINENTINEEIYSLVAHIRG